MINMINKQSNHKGLHGLSPYIGKIRPELARSLVEEYCPKKGIIFDPFCGSGTVPLEGWLSGRNVIANDLNTYAIWLTKGKLFPILDEKKAQKRLLAYNEIIQKTKVKRSLPHWVRSFFHPKTLKEIICWVDILKSRREYFLLSSLLGILHHQRPGFLSFPSSHGTPYLRTNKFPVSEYPHLYEYRNVYERLSSKVARVFKDFPTVDAGLSRIVTNDCASKCRLKVKRVHMVLTSPPYMRALTYARDNRLRLWFLGIEDYASLDSKISPNKKEFELLMKKSFKRWSNFQRKHDKCVLVVGDMYFNKTTKQTLEDFVIMTSEKAGYRLFSTSRDPIPQKKRVIKKASAIKAEKILVLKKLK